MVPEQTIQHDAFEGLRVGYMLRMYPRFTQTFVVNEILELERQGARVHILSLRKPTDGRFHESISRVQAKAEYLPECLTECPGKIAAEQWAVLRGRPGRWLRAAWAVMRHAGVDFTDLWQAVMVLRWVRKRRLDHVHVHFGTHEASVAYLAAGLGNLSYSLTLHAFDIFRDNVDLKLLTEKINASRFAVTVSEFNRRFLLERCPGVEPEKVRVSYNGIDLDWFAYRRVDRKPGTLLAVGRLIEKKGFIYLVRAVGQLRDRGLAVSCTLVGDGPEEGALREEIARLGLKNLVTLAGALPQEAVRRLLGESACMVLPCVRAADGNIDALPTVLLEALAAGCPCVSTRLSGVPEIIEHEVSGLLVEPGDPGALAEALARIMTEPDLPDTLARNGRMTAERLFDVRAAAGRLGKWFAEAVRQEALPIVSQEAQASAFKRRPGVPAGV